MNGIIILWKYLPISEPFCSYVFGVNISKNCYDAAKQLKSLKPKLWGFEEMARLFKQHGLLALSSSF